MQNEKTTKTHQGILSSSPENVWKTDKETNEWISWDQFDVWSIQFVAAWSSSSNIALTCKESNSDTFNKRLMTSSQSNQIKSIFIFLFFFVVDTW